LLEKIFSEFNIDIVIHLAAKAGVRNSFIEPKEYYSVNVDGTSNILNIVKRYNTKKFIFASSSSVYGNCENEKFSENLKNLKPISPYAQTKLICEENIKKYSLNNSICLRLFTVYGKRQRPDLAIKKFTQKILNDEPIEIYGDGTTYRDYTNIEDIIEGIKKSINYNSTKYEIFNLGSGNAIQLNEMVKMIENKLQKKAIIKHIPMQCGDVNKTFADTTKAQKLLNWKPKINFQDGLNSFIDSFIREQNYQK